MVNGVVSLRCPACGRPFISLQQQPGTLIMCPHCARSAAWEAYPSAGEAKVEALPIQRRGGSPKSVAPAAVPTAPRPVSPLSAITQPRGQPRPSLFGPAQTPVWPPAPEQAPMFSPGAAPLFPPAPAASVGWPPAMPALAPAPPTQPSAPPQVQIPAAAAMPMPAPVVSPFAVAPPPPLAPAQVPASFVEIPPAAETVAAPEPAPAVLSPSLAVNRMTPGEPSLDAPSWQPVREERNAPLGILLVLVLALVGWLAWESQRPPMAVELPAPQPVSETPAVVPQAEIKEVKANAAPVKAAEEPAPQEPPPEIRKAELVTPPVPVVAPKRPQGTRASVDNPDALIRSLFSAKSMEARAELIAHPEDNRADMEGFFDRNPVALKALQPAGADLLSIPGQEASPLFQVVTDKNPKGALLRLVPTAEGLRVDWPLFAETHERKLAGYLAEKKDQPAWFHVILRRSHGLELPEAERAQHLCLDVQASADDSVRCLAVVPKDTPLGRFFDREAAWGNVYVSRLLLQRQRGADELLGVIVLDCEGAAKGALSSVGSSGR